MSVKVAGGAIARKFKVDITSDVLCPFCLIGTKQLLLAIDQYNDNHTSSPLDVDIRLLPYQLNPGMSEKPITRAEMYAKKFGAQRAESLKEGMIARFAALGYKTELGGNTSSSHIAHRLQTYALLQHPEKQLPLAMDIFELYHIQGIHPADKPSLASLAVKHGIFSTTEEATVWLDGEDCEKEVQAGYGIAKRMGITGVPFFVFEGKYAASGAMGVEEFVHLFEEINKREKEDNLTPSPTSTAVSPPGSEVERSKVVA